ncbi:DMT family transporter [Streptomyces sp. NRRL S-118]|uniref:DMT family transporter n=1 Tax=Streptomyces sp. NRRL S-118 TaxID=1463881 RepID=UPI0004C6BB75|nr:DMT family transporter [Streptomyces sp. NRRL S-118]
MGVLLPTLFALCAAASNALATVLQRRATLTVPQAQGFRPGLLLDLLRRPIWLAGMLAVIVAGVGQAVALATGPLALVQPLFVLELPLALLFGSLADRQRLARPLWAAVAAVVAGLGLALMAAAPEGNRTHVPLDRWVPTLAGCAVVVLALTTAALRRPPGRARAGCLGAATAVCYALTAALMKTSMHILDDSGVGAFFSTWHTYAFAVCGICALLLLEHALQGGPLVASQPALTLGDAGVSLVLGVLLYEEHVRTGWWLVPELLGVGLIVVGVFTLARAGASTG